MDLENTLRGIQTKIKFGRVAGVRNSLISLLDQYTDSEYEAEILEVFTLVFLKSIKDYKSSTPLLNRLLSLNISESLRKRSIDFLQECENNEKIVPSEPDLNNPDFVEFIEFIRSNGIFNAPKLGRINRYFTIKDLEKAKKLAWHQGIEPPFMSWNGLRTKVAKQVYTYYFENQINMNLIDDHISSEIMKTCETSISTEFMNFFDDIYGDFVEIARGKLVRISTTLHESMWEAYKEGFFPCGWKGDFPNGKLCVFLPVPASK
jgi:hypothetical protein